MGKVARIQTVVDKHFKPDPYHAGRVAHAMMVDSAVNAMYRIREILQEEGEDTPMDELIAKLELAERDCLAEYEHRRYSFVWAPTAARWKDKAASIRYAIDTAQALRA